MDFQLKNSKLYMFWSDFSKFKGVSVKYSSARMEVEIKVAQEIFSETLAVQNQQGPDATRLDDFINVMVGRSATVARFDPFFSFLFSI